MYQPEILAPAGSYSAFLAAVHNGCNAVYLSGNKDGARAYAKNFDNETLKKVVDYAALFSVKIYYAINTVFKEKEIKDLTIRINALRAMGINTFIVQDIGIINSLKNLYVDIELHGSTQINCHSIYGIDFLEKLGVSRVILARELSNEEIKYINSNRPLMEIETFVHGALCYSYSGQCLMSSFLGGRSGNRGRCAQPCRLTYQPEINGQKKKKSPILSLKDIETLTFIPELMKLEIASFKIEGRMKSPEYVGLITYLYRHYTDMFIEKGYINIDEKDLENMSQIFNRGDFSNGYYNNAGGPKMITMDQPKHQGLVVGKIKDRDKSSLIIDLFVDLEKDDYIEVVLTNGEWYAHKITEQLKKGNTKISFNKQAKINSPIRRIKSILLNKMIQEQNKHYKKQSLSMEVILKIDNPISLKIYDSNRSVIVSGDIVQKAVKQGLTKKRVTDQLVKVGNYPVAVKNMTIICDDEVFIPISKLNELRRKGLDLWFDISGKALQSAVLEKRPIIKNKSTNEYSISVLVRTMEQLKIVLQYFVDTIYIDWINFDRNTIDDIIKEVQYKGIKVFFVMPKIIRQKDELFLEKEVHRFINDIDGFLIRSIDTYEYLSHYKKEIIWDYDLSIMNMETLLYYQELEKNSYYMPSLELNKYELSDLDLKKSECLAYGHIRVMTSAQCVRKNSEGCIIKQGGILHLEDRKNIKVPVETICNMCYNRIYNGVPQFLLDKKVSLQSMGISRFRIEFLEESEKKIHEIMKMTTNNSSAYSKLDSFTRGHFNKGVE